jgi:hypothetical protein
MGIFDSMSDAFFGEDNAAGEANKYYDQIPEAMRKYLDPSFQRGERAGEKLEGQYGSMMDNPQDFINAIMKGYKPSEGYQFKQEQMGQAASNSAAAGGMRGTPFEQQQQQQITQGLLGADQQEWLKNVLGIQDRGMRGEEGLYGYGQQAGTNLAESEANVLGTKGKMAYDQERNRSKRGQDMFGAITSAIGAGFGMPSFGGMSGTDDFYGGS